MKRIALVTILFSSLLFAQGPNKPPAVEGEPTKTASGLEYWDVKVGTGRAAKFGDDVIVNYTG